MAWAGRAGLAGWAGLKSVLLARVGWAGPRQVRQAGLVVGLSHRLVSDTSDKPALGLKLVSDSLAGPCLRWAWS